MDETMLEVIALNAEDAVAAARGGAERLEIVSAIEVGGLTPEVTTFERIRAATDLPLRVMLRTNGGFGIRPEELAGLCDAATALRRAGADQFVFGFLTPDGALDLAAIGALIATIAPCPWTFHRAFDQATDPRAAWAMISGLPGVDAILSSGTRGNLPDGLAGYRERAAWQTGRLRWLAGGGLESAQIAPLRAAGIAQFHAGRLVRAGESWERPVDEAATRAVREQIRSGA